MPSHPNLDSAVDLLRKLVATPSFSREESATADIWENWLRANGVVNVKRLHNNVFALTTEFDASKPLLRTLKTARFTDSAATMLGLQA